MLTLWRFLVICAAGLMLSWVPHIWRTRWKSDDPLAGEDLALCLGFILAGLIIGSGQAAGQHLKFGWGLPLTTIGLAFGLRARIRAFTRQHKEPEE